MQDLLKSGETALREADKDGAIEEYKKLANFFYENPEVCDYQTAAYFYKRMNSIAKSMGVINLNRRVVFVTTHLFKINIKSSIVFSHPW